MPPSGPWALTLRHPESAAVGKPFNISVVPGQVRELRSILQGDFSHTKDSRCEEREKNKKVQDEDGAEVIQETMIQVQIVSVLFNTNAPKLPTQAEASLSGDEAAGLRGQNSVLTRRGQHQMQEIRRLNEVSGLSGRLRLV